MMRQGTFREDLYYRLQVIEVHVPPLRERREEIPQLIEFFLLKFASVYHRPPVRPSLVLQEALLSYEWPGNIRELENMMKRLVVLQDETLILAELGRLRTARANAEAEARRTSASGTPAQPHAAVGVPMPRPIGRRSPPPAAFAMPAPASASSPADGIAAAMGADGVNLQELARARGDGRREGSDPARARALPLEPPQDGRVPAGELQDAAEQDEGMRDQRIAATLRHSCAAGFD